MSKKPGLVRIDIPSELESIIEPQDLAEPIVQQIARNYGGVKEVAAYISTTAMNEPYTIEINKTNLSDLELVDLYCDLLDKYEADDALEKIGEALGADLVVTILNGNSFNVSDIFIKDLEK